MPLVTARPRSLQNGNILTEFTDTTSTTEVTYTFPTIQTGIIIENSGEYDIFVTVGRYTNQVIKANKKWSVDVSFSSFFIRSDVNSQEFIATAIFKNTQETKVYTPSGFSWVDHPLKDKVSIDNSGKYIVNYDVSVNQPTGKTYYVDQGAGNDANDGLTPGTALKKILTAYNKSDVKVIILCNERWYYANEFNGVITINKSVSLKTLYGAKAVLSNHNSTSWAKTAGATSVYQATRANASIVVDITRKDSFGDRLALKLVSSIAECDATDDSYFISGTTVYTHIKGGGSPGFGIYILQNDVPAIEINLTNTGLLYMENIDVLGGFVVNGSGGSVFGKNCNFQYGKTDDSVNIAGAFSILQNCVGSQGLYDGFSYSGAIGAIEINCVGRNNGIGVGNTNNGSTAHTGSKVIRVNGNYFNNQGPNVADVQDNTESWNMGCTAHDSLGTDTQQCDFQTQDGLAKMFLEGCTGFNSLYSIRANTTAKMYIRNNDFSTFSLVNPATIEEY